MCEPARWHQHVEEFVLDEISYPPTGVLDLRRTSCKSLRVGARKSARQPRPHPYPGQPGARAGAAYSDRGDTGPRHAGRRRDPRRQHARGREDRHHGPQEQGPPEQTNRVRAPVKFWVIIVVLVLLLTGCGGLQATPDTQSQRTPQSSETTTAWKDETTSEPSGLRTLVIDASGGKKVEVRVEVADDLAEQAKGLMDRTTLGENRGMLFVYPEPTQYALEVNQGFFESRGVKVGDSVELPG